MKYFLGIMFVIIVMLSCQSHTLQNRSIKTAQHCLAHNNQYWYQNICWNHADEINQHKLYEKDISTHIDESVTTYQQAISQSYIKINGISYGLSDVFWYEHQKDDTRLALTFSIDGKRHSLLLLQNHVQVVDASHNDIAVTGVFMQGNPIFGDKVTRNNVISYGTLQVGVTIIDEEKEYKKSKKFNDHNQVYVQFITGVLKSGDRIVANFSSNMMDGGDVDMRISGNKVRISGTVGIQTYIELHELIQKETMIKELGGTAIKTVILKDVFGSSIHDPILMHIGKLIRQEGWNIYVPKYSAVESGAVLLLVAGVERVIDKETDIGIHSWCCFFNMEAKKLPQEHPIHQSLLDYFTQMLGKNIGPQFYFKLLNTASVSSNETYYMTEDEIKEYYLATEIGD